MIQASIFFFPLVSNYDKTNASDDQDLNRSLQHDLLDVKETKEHIY